MKALSAPKSLHNLSLPTVVIKLLVASCNHIFHGFHSLEYQHIAKLVRFRHVVRRT